jgi:hypothetical protein
VDAIETSLIEAIAKLYEKLATILIDKLQRQKWSKVKNRRQTLRA